MVRSASGCAQPLPLHLLGEPFVSVLLLRRVSVEVVELLAHAAGRVLAKDPRCSCESQRTEGADQICRTRGRSRVFSPAGTARPRGSCRSSGSRTRRRSRWCPGWPCPGIRRACLRGRSGGGGGGGRGGHVLSRAGRHRQHVPAVKAQRGGDTGGWRSCRAVTLSLWRDYSDVPRVINEAK